MTVYINGVATTGDMLKSTYDPDKDGIIALAQLAAAVCSMTETLVPDLFLELFQKNAATGTMSFRQRVNDNETTTVARADAIGEYAEVDFGQTVKISRYRQFGKTTHTGDGRFKIEYYDGAWHDWVTEIAVRTTEDWSTFAAPAASVWCSKIRITATTIDTGGYNYIAEIEILG